MDLYLLSADFDRRLKHEFLTLTRGSMISSQASRYCVPTLITQFQLGSRNDTGVMTHVGRQVTEKVAIAILIEGATYRQIGEYADQRESH